jgi:Zn-dependent protease with chaperone function/Zn-finger nucleic acid-binding protein
VCLGLFFPSASFPLANRLSTLLWIVVLAAVAIAGFHFWDARRFGASFIRKRLQARAPDPQDRYHKQFANTVEEIRIASGLPQVNPYIIPVFAINSMALIERDNTPSIIVTEGMLAEFTRDELQAVVAHELAHIIRGDTFYVTLVCSLANFFERLRQAMEPEETPQPVGTRAGPGYQGGQILVLLAASFSGLLMHFLSTLISRQREILADAAAVEFSRNPAALARAIYKAHLKNSFVGDFNLTYAPLFIVPPESRELTEGFLGRIFSSHPPLLKRIRLLAEMIPASPGEIMRDVHAGRKQREKARRMLLAQEESEPAGVGGNHKPAEESPNQGQIWSIRDAKGDWQGPFALEEVINLPYFSLGIWMRNLQEKVQAPAREFPQLQLGLRSLYQKKHINPKRQNKCPRCRVPLREGFYEGVAIKGCPDCGGKLVDAALTDRIVARKEMSFSEHLIQKARTFEEEFMRNPSRTRKLTMETPSKLFCPECGHKLLPRPYNYQYVLPVDKCLACYKIWFDPDELEILQILIEKL